MNSIHFCHGFELTPKETKQSIKEKRELRIDSLECLGDIVKSLTLTTTALIDGSVPNKSHAPNIGYAASILLDLSKAISFDLGKFETKQNDKEV